MLNKKIVLIDDHIIVRNGLKELIEKLGPYTISEEFDNGSMFLGWLRAGNSADLIILDYNMPGMSGEQVLEEMNAKQYNIPVLVLTLNDDERTIIRLFRLGVKGYITKNCSAGVLNQALNDILAKGYFHNDFLTLSLRNDTPPKKKTEQDKILEQLTMREKQFLKLVCDEKEYTYEQIADKMNLSVRNVDACREELFSKFGIKSKTGLVLFVLKYKIIDLIG